MADKKEEKISSNLKKKADGYNYKYTELAQINEYIDALGERYYQYPETNEANGYDYIMTVRIIDGKPQPPIRGCKIVEAKLQNKSNPIQEYGSSLTYARRYSLLMAYGLATTDDDALCFDGATEEKPKGKSEEYKKLKQEIQEYADGHNMKMSEIAKDYKLSANSTEADLEKCLADLKGENNAE